MVSFWELHGAKPATWSVSAMDLLHAAKQCERIKDDIHDNGVKKLDHDWIAKAYGPARTVLNMVARQAEAASILARSVVEPLDTLNHAIQIAQSELAAALHKANDYGLAPDQHGIVGGVPARTADGALKQAKAIDEVQHMIDHALQAATEADALCTEALTSAMKADIRKIPIGDLTILTPSERERVSRETGTVPEFNPYSAQVIQSDNIKKALGELRDTIPVDRPAEDVATWWNNLPQTEKSNLMRACPLELYDLRGIPDLVKRQLARTENGYNSVDAVRYAKDNWNNKRLDWAGKDNCVNFVSDALRYGGKMAPKVSGLGIISPNLDKNGWNATSNENSNVLPPGLTHSHSWGGAQQSYDFFHNNGGVTVPPTGARPGDILYYKSSDTEKPYHAAIVTGVLPDGEILYTQHTRSHESNPFYGRLPEVAQWQGAQTTEIIRPKVTW